MTNRRPRYRDRRRYLDHYLDTQVARKRLKGQARYDRLILTMMALCDNLLTARGIHAFCVHKKIGIGCNKVWARLEHLRKKGAVERAGLAPGPRYLKDCKDTKNYLWRLT